jgi:hypothetical protein
MTKLDKTQCMETSYNPIKQKYVSKLTNKNTDNVL